MTCDTCGAPTELVDSNGATVEGSFTEKYECVNGHTGTITGKAEKPAKCWSKYGSVFKDD